MTINDNDDDDDDKNDDNDDDDNTDDDDDNDRNIVLISGAPLIFIGSWIAVKIKTEDVV